MIEENISLFADYFHQNEKSPWLCTAAINEYVLQKIATLQNDYIIENNVAIHNTAVIEQNAVIKSPAIIGQNCFIGANAYLRGGVFLGKNVTIGVGCEIKSSFVFDKTAIAHFNFIGDSIVGSHVNIEAGAVTANHFNERDDKNIFVFYNNQLINTNSNKFGALIGDHCKIGANAVLSPGTILPAKSIVNRLALINQSPVNS
jgi:UDP-N-acetylglucosamine diphosphorylase / glucose-1-phosphate thymidylyltransferase / UDP-N-acetylgalactosamine diphosphorylase / glucosamine-1-phosphate N-acetyltransferase / galactosamine-1-phosphate N-acetyltransferase